MWLNCSGSLLLNAGYGDDAGEDAATGTIAHHVAEVWNRTGKRPDHLVGKQLPAEAGGNTYKVPVTEEMMAYVESYVSWCNELPGDHYFEQRVDFSELTPIPEQGGTADHFACEFGRLTITDLKYGTGIRVYADHNPQAMLYASGVFLAWDWMYSFEKIVIRICQPRLDVFEVWECSRAELLEFMSFVKRQARAAWVENAPRTPSPKACQWCAGKSTCPARLLEVEALVDDTFLDLDEDERTERTYEAKDLQVETEPKIQLNQPIHPLSTAALAATLRRRRHVETWFKAIAEELLARAEQGEKVPGWKLVDGRVKRVWRDEGAVIKYLEEVGLDADEFMPRTMKTPNAVEKLLRAEGLKPKDIKAVMPKLVDAHAGKRTLTMEKDDRPDVNEVVDDFETED
jgi:hypothetical protein